MIIEAGYDLTTLLFDRARDSSELRIVMLDAELRLLSAQLVVPRFDGSLGTATLEAVDAAIPEPDEDDDEVSARSAVRYVALGYHIPSIEGYPSASTGIGCGCLTNGWDAPASPFSGSRSPTARGGRRADRCIVSRSTGSHQSIKR